jgi:hypothetical protein
MQTGAIRIINLNPAPRDGFTRTDFLVTLAAAAVLAALVIAPRTVARDKSRLETCTRNLGQVGRAVLHFAEEHASTLPGLLRTESGDPWWWYKEEIRSYLGSPGSASAVDPAFACPLDRGYSDPRPFCRNSRFDSNSYVFNGVTLFGTPNIAGWKLTEVTQPKRTLLVMEWTAHAPLSWHRSRTGKANAPFYRDAESVVAFADGHTDFIRVYYDGHNPAYTRDPISGYDYQYSGH